MWITNGGLPPTSPPRLGADRSRASAASRCPGQVVRPGFPPRATSSRSCRCGPGSPPEPRARRRPLARPRPCCPRSAGLRGPAVASGTRPASESSAPSGGLAHAAGRAVLRRLPACLAGRSAPSSSPSASSPTWAWRFNTAIRCWRCIWAGSRDSGRIQPEQISVGKLNNVREASPPSPASAAPSSAATASRSSTPLLRPMANNLVRPDLREGTTTRSTPLVVGRPHRAGGLPLDQPGRRIRVPSRRRPSACSRWSGLATARRRGRAR